MRNSTATSINLEESYLPRVQSLRKNFIEQNKDHPLHQVILGIFDTLITNIRNAWRENLRLKDLDMILQHASFLQRMVDDSTLIFSDFSAKKTEFEEALKNDSSLTLVEFLKAKLESTALVAWLHALDSLRNNLENISKPLGLLEKTASSIDTRLDYLVDITNTARIAIKNALAEHSLLKNDCGLKKEIRAFEESIVERYLQPGIGASKKAESLMKDIVTLARLLPGQPDELISSQHSSTTQSGEESDEETDDETTSTSASSFFSSHRSQSPHSPHAANKEPENSRKRSRSPSGDARSPSP